MKTPTCEMHYKGLFRPDASAQNVGVKHNALDFLTHVSQSDHSDRPRRIKNYTIETPSFDAGASGLE